MSSRSLTPGERALVENHYGDRIDLARKIHEGAGECRRTRCFGL